MAWGYLWDSDGVCRGEFYNRVAVKIRQGLSTYLPGGKFKDKLKRRSDMLGTILIIIVVVMLIGAVPRWPHSRKWGYYPSGGLGFVLVILIILLLLGRF
jgi:hypothetical protein